MPDTQVHNGPVTTPLSMSPQPPPRSRKHWVWLLLAGGAFLTALAALAVVLVVNTGKSTPAVNPATVYQQKLSSTLTPMVAANQTLSASLQSLDGSKASIHNSRTATTNAQQALTAANGAVAIITVPRSSTQLSQQAKQALTQETGYLQSVNTTLSDPTGNTTASVQPLASATSSAFVPLASVAPGGSASIYGVDDLLSWAQGAVSAERRNTRPTVINNNNTTVVPSQPQTPAVIPTPTPSSSTSLCTDTVGNSDISVGSHVSCPFAKNVLIAAARYYQSNGHLPDGVSLSVSSPTTGGTYMVAYSVSSDGGTIYAYNTESSSSDGNDITFSSSLANGTGPN
jgi:hypothetical protein